MSDDKPEEKPYRCKRCGYSTNDLQDFVDHYADETYGKGHRTVEEFLDCKYCYPLFERELLRRGWKKPRKKKPSAKDVLPHRHLLTPNDMEVRDRDYAKLYIC